MFEIPVAAAAPAHLEQHSSAPISPRAVAPVVAPGAAPSVAPSVAPEFGPVASVPADEKKRPAQPVAPVQRKRRFREISALKDSLAPTDVTPKRERLSRAFLRDEHPAAKRAKKMTNP